MDDAFLKYKAIRVPLYGGKLIIVASNSSEKVKKLIPHFNKKEAEFYAHAWQINYHGLNGYAMILNFGSLYRITHGSIAHEALHLTHYIADNVNIVADFNNDEPLAYLTGWIVNQVYDFLDKNGLEVACLKG